MTALALLPVLAAAGATVLATHWACDAAAVRVRLARHRRRTRRDGRMLRRALQASAPRTGEW